MEICLIFALVAAFVWGLVAVKYQQNLLNGAHILPLVGYLVILTGAVFSSEFFSVSGPIPITIDRLLLGGMCAAFFLMVVGRQESILKLNRVDLAVIFLTGVITYSTITHDYTFLGNMPASRLLFFNLMPAALYFVMRNARLNDSNLKLIAAGMVGLGVYLALTAIAETRGLGALVFPRYIMDPDFEEFLGRGRGPFLNPVSNGVFMVIGLTSLWMWWPNATLRRRGVILCVAALFCVGVYSTLTRSVWLGLIIAALIAVWIPAPRQSKGGMVIAGALALAILFPVIGEKLFSFKRDKNVTVSEMENSARLRPLFVTVAARMTADRPLFGCGFGQYAREKYPYLQDPTSRQPLSATKSYMQHNIFLAYVTETGLVGLSSLLLMLTMFARIGFRTWRNQRLSHWRRQYGLLLMVFLSNHAVNGMFHDVSIIPMENMLMFFIAAITNNIYTRERESNSVYSMPDRSAADDRVWQAA